MVGGGGENGCMVRHSGWTRGDKIVGCVHDDGRGLCVIGVCCEHVDIAC